MIDFEMELAEVNEALRTTDRILMQLYRADEQIANAEKRNAIKWIFADSETVAFPQRSEERLHREMAMAIQALDDLSQKLLEVSFRDWSIGTDYYIGWMNDFSFKEKETDEKVKDAIGIVEAIQRKLKAKETEIIEILNH